MRGLPSSQAGPIFTLAVASPMIPPSVPSGSTTAARRIELAAAADFDLVELRAGSPLAIQLLPSGALFALRHGPTLINQLLPGPAEEGLFRLMLRWRESAAGPAGWISLASPGLRFERTGPTAVRWTSTPRPGVRAEAELRLHDEKSAWRWRVRVGNESDAPFTAEVFHAQDLGLADEAAVRNNEAYTSQYIDFQPLHAPEAGWALFARQNLPMRGGRHPWLACACPSGATAFCTDGHQFFGDDHRLTNTPAALRAGKLPSRRLQYEFALAGLQSSGLAVAPGQNAEVSFVMRFVEDHPDASGAGDLALVREMLAWTWREDGASSASPSAGMAARSLFLRAPWAHGEMPTASDWAAWFPGERRQEEHGADGTVQSFFQGAATHVVSLAKEARIARPHGHILRSGEARWFDAGHFGLTCYASGIFAAQAYLGNPSFARLLSVVRNPLHVVRAAGQRVFVRDKGDWRQLGVPSAFAMTPGGAQWLYRCDGRVIEAHVSCAASEPVARLGLRVLTGAACEFLVTHELALDAAEYEHGGGIEIHEDAGWIGCYPAEESLVGRHEPQVGFAIAAADPADFAAIGGDELLYDDGAGRSGPYAVLRSRPGRSCGVLLLGARGDRTTLALAVEAARKTVATPGSAVAPDAPVKLRGGRDAGVGRIDEILPWFAHNAAIHFSAPHGLEQYGGAAWGVRDVCQGSIEWLLTAGDFAVARRVLETVFAQQYATDGSWPQWFMFPPYRFIQQAHSHGDVCFWPVKALCDYVEASNDLAFLQARVGYTDPKRFEPAGPSETILVHCDRVVDQCEARFMAGTALVNYGDGDWDDTLQPADPTLRTRMTSAWTVGLAYHAFRQLAEVCRRAGDLARAERLGQLLARMRQDFATHLLPGGVIAGFVIAEENGKLRPLLHSDDTVTGIRYRLLPMTRSILAELFTPAEALRHLQVIEHALWCPDGVRLMSEPTKYHGGVSRLFQRAETAANVGREIGLQYVHAHLRYAEALAKVGDANGLWHALQVVNPVGLDAVVPTAAPRQSNMYFSSSDADFADRYEAAERWSELRAGRVAVRGGWRLYSSGPGLFLHKVRACLLGVREKFDEVVFDPVLPFRLDGLTADVRLSGRTVELHYRVRERTYAPQTITINGAPCDTSHREMNPYRSGGVRVARVELANRLRDGRNVIEIGL